MILSKIKNTQSKISFPQFKQGLLYMYELDLENPILPEEFKNWYPVVSKFIELSPVKAGTSYLTIDCKEITKGQTHRRGGPHIDGNYGPSGWGTSGNGWKKDPSEKGGMIIASNYESCKSWVGEYNDTPKEGGDCSHVDLTSMEQILLEKNVVYITNSSNIHESIPVVDDVNRSLIRLTLPEDSKVL